MGYGKAKWALGSAFAAVLLGPGCIGIPDGAAPPTLATHVEDWRDEVIYQALTDRFANGDVNNDYNVRPGLLSRYQGGDWKGMEERLPYLKELGITTVWISPSVRNVETDADMDAYHGYWAQDLTQPNPHFGDMGALRSLVRRAHELGMKIVLDIVTNHMGQVFFYDINMNGRPDVYVSGSGLKRSWDTPTGNERVKFQRITEYDPDWDPNGIQAGQPWDPNPHLAGRAPIVFINDPLVNRVPPKPDVFARATSYHGLGRIVDYDAPGQTELGDFPGGLKDVATENPDVRAAFVDVFSKWVEWTDIDGFRIDTVKHVEHDFWKVFSKGVRDRLASQGKKNFLMFGEAFDGNDEKIGSYTKPGELDSVFYFSQHYRVFQSVFVTAHKATGQGGTKNIEDLWNDRTKNFGTQPQPGGITVAPAKALVNFLDNHDVARFLFDAEGDVDALRNALTLLVTEEGIPCLYYGTEQDFRGGNDPANREVLWTSGFGTSGDTFRHFAKLTRIRRAYKALSRGDTNVVFATNHTGSEEDAGMFAFERGGGDAGDRYALVVLNTNGKKASRTVADGVPMGLRVAPRTILVDLLDPQARQYSVDGEGKLNLVVPKQSAMILVPLSQVVPL